jgi:hypothetical protein
MTLRDYPSFQSESTMAQDLRRVSQIRHDDANIIQALQDSSTYRQAFYPNVREVSASTAVGKFDYHIEGDTTAGNITITLPNDQNIGCREIVISKKVAGNQITIDGNGKTINGSATHVLNAVHKVHAFHYLPAAGEWRILWSS